MKCVTDKKEGPDASQVEKNVGSEDREADVIDSTTVKQDENSEPGAAWLAAVFKGAAKKSSDDDLL